MANEQYGVTLTADSSQYQQSIQQSANATNSLTDALTRAGAAVTNLWQRTNRKLTFIAAGEVAAFTAMTVSAANLEQQMSQLQARQVLLNRSTTEYVGTVTALRTGYGQTSAQAIQLLQQMNQLQVPFRQQQATAANYVKMSAVTGENVGQLAQSQQTFMRTMGASQRTVENYSSMMSKLNASTGASAAATADFATSIAPLSKTVGMTTQQIAGISASFVKAGADGGAAANVYTKIMSDINKAAQYGGPELKVYSDLLGVSVDTFKQMPKAEVVTRIFDDLNKQGPQAIKTLEQLGLEGVRSQRAIAAVVQQGGFGINIANAKTGYSDTSDYNKAAAKAMSGLNDELAKTKESINAVAQGMGSVFLPAVQGVTHVVNMALKPLTAMGDIFTKMPDSIKSIGAALATAFVGFNFLPRIVAGLTGASWIAQGLRGPVSQGARAGFRPGGAMNQTQRDFLGGEGAAGPRTLFRMGQFLGRNARPQTWIERWGGDPSLYQGIGRGGSVGDVTRRAMIGGIDLAGSLARSTQLPWQPAYLRNSAQMHLNKNISEMMLTDKSTWKEAIKTGSFSMLGLNRGKEGEDWVKPLGEAAKDSTKQMKAQTEEVKKSRTIFGALASNAGKFLQSSGNMMLGAAGMGARGVQRVGSKIGQFAMGALEDIGPLGIALGVGGAAFAGGKSIYDRIKSDRAAADTTGEDVSAGSTYRDALGQSSKALLTFSDALKQATSSLGDGAKTINEALTVTASDVSTAARMTETKDQFLATRPSISQASQFVAAAVRNNTSPEALTGMKLDLIKQYGPEVANRILAGGASATGTSPYGLYDLSRQGTSPFLSKGNLSVAGAVTSQIQIDQANAAAQGQQASSQNYIGQLTGIAGLAYRAGQHPVGQLNVATGYGASSTGVAAPGSMANNPVVQEAVTNFLKANPNLSQSDAGTFTSAITDFSKSVQGQGLNQEQFEKQFSSYLEQQAKNDDFGSVEFRRTINEAYKNNGGIVPTTGKTARQIAEERRQADPFGNWGTADARAQMASRSPQLARLLSFGQSAATSPVLTSMGAEQNTDLAGRAVTALYHDAMEQAGGDFTKAGNIVRELGVNADATAGNFAQLAAATQALIVKQQNFAAISSGQNTLGDQAGRFIGNFQGTIGQYQAIRAKNQQDQRLPGLRDDLEAQKEQASQLYNQVNDYVQNLNQQYRSFDHQREQGQAQMDRSIDRSARDYGIQMSQAEEDFSTQRSRNEESYQIQRSRGIADFHTQEMRATADFNKQRSREETDHNLQLVRQAEDAAKSIYDVYHRVGTQQTWDAKSLLSNMAEQQQRIGEQQSNLAAVRKLGLSDKTISQLGLNEAGNSQQLARLLQGLQEDPRLAGQYNKMAQSRQAGSGALLQDPSNTGFQRGEEDRKKSLKRNQDDFDESMDRQRSDFRKQLNRSAEDFSRSMGQAQSDFDKMRKRQRENLKRGWQDMRSDFNYQMDITEENISFFAEQVTTSFDVAFKNVESRTHGETKKQVQAMGGMMDGLEYVVITSIDDMDTTVAGPYKKWNLQPAGKSAKVPASTGGNNSTQSGAHGAGGSHAAVGGPNDSTDYTSLGGGGGGGGSDNNHGWPLKSHRIGTPWGKKGAWNGSRTLGPGHHSGDDFPAATGTAIHAAEDGEVVFTGWGGAYGNMTKIAHGNGVQTWYAHQSKIDTKRGARVDQGDVIGRVGETGRAFGSHLHFEVRVNGRDIDPKKWLGGAATPSGGGGGMDEPKPDFAAMTKGFEDQIAKSEYMAKQRTQFRSGFYFTKGDLAAAISKDFSEKWQAKHGANYSDPGGGGGGIDAGGQGGSRGVWNALRTGGLSAKQAAGVMGNIQHESGFSWNIRQGGSHSNNPSSTSAGYGLVQWTPGHKLTDILKKMGKKNSLENQIAALFHQLSGKGPHAEGHAGSMLRKANSVFDATKAFLRGYERAADTSDSAVSRRNKASEHWYKTYHNAPLPSSGGGDAGESGGKGMDAAKKMGYKLGAKPINRHSDPSGKPSFDMMIQNMTEGNNIAANLKKFHRDYGMEYVIWNMKIASNRENWNWRKYHPITNQGDYQHKHHVHSTYHGGTDAATPGWSLVGEQGPEFIKTRGGERILNAIQSKYAVMAAKAGQVVTTQSGGASVTNNSFDHSVQVASVTVKADSPRGMIAELEREARLAALTGVGK